MVSDNRAVTGEFENIERCSKCGTCMAHCPSYNLFREETASPRGRVALCGALADRRVTLPEVTSLAVDRCLRCLRCVAACPSGVRVDEVLLAASDKCYSRGLTGIVRSALLRGVLPHRRVFQGMMRAFSGAQNILGLRGRAVRHLPLFPLRGKLPRLAMASAARLLRARRPVPEKKNMTVTFFLGCLSNFVFPEVAQVAVAALERSGIRVIIPPEQTCCGTPAWVTGDIESARRLARINMAALKAENADAILTACASCGRMLKNSYQELVGSEAAREFAAKVDDATRFLSARPENAAARRRMERDVVAYHRPCHARWYDAEEVVESLGRRLGTKVLLLPDFCCGGAGTFSMRFPEQGRAIAATTLRAIEHHNVTTVLTPCPGCMMQLREVTADAGMRVAVQHPVGMF